MTSLGTTLKPADTGYHVEYPPLAILDEIISCLLISFLGPPWLTATAGLTVDGGADGGADRDAAASERANSRRRDKRLRPSRAHWSTKTSMGGYTPPLVRWRIIHYYSAGRLPK